MRVARQVVARLGQQRGDDREFARELCLGFARQRELVGPELDDVVVNRALVRRRVALLGPDTHVIGGVARPGLEHAGIEVEAVHFCAYERLVDLRLERPAAAVDGFEPAAPGRELMQAPGGGRGRVVRSAVLQGRVLEGAPFLEQLYESVITRRRGRLGSVDLGD